MLAGNAQTAISPPPALCYWIPHHPLLRTVTLGSGINNATSDGATTAEAIAISGVITRGVVRASGNLVECYRLATVMPAVTR